MTLRQSIITVTWDDAERPKGVDSDEWAYVLRMGGIDAEFVTTHEDFPREASQCGGGS